MDAKERVARWLADESVDEETKRQIRAMDEKELEERFYSDLSFGTGGLRGLIGVGSNRLNRYTIRRATQGLAAYLLEHVPQAAQRGVVIAYDSRHRSAEFALETAAVLNGNGIKAYVFRSLRPTPQLSFAVRELGAAAGVVITASHNPPEYNGYKVYDADGVQVVPRIAARITEAIDRVTSFSQVRRLDREAAEAAGLFRWLGEEMDERYIERLQTLLLRPEVVGQTGRDMRIVYTPLHGAGRWPVEQVLRRAGFEQLYVVDEQAEPDPDFSTVKTPNPEEPDALAMALDLATRVDAHLVLGTDPDCDRVGVLVRRRDGQYVRLTGNQLGALLLDYILSTRQEKGTLPEKGVLITTIVSSELGRAIARRYGVETINTLTGFKYIG
nr:phosphoglucomutase [Bacillota bacterium]